jgi:hypothetical protein
MKYSMLCCFIALAFLSNAQSITGTVMDQNGNSIECANIYCKGKTTIPTVSSANGTYSLPLRLYTQRIKNGDTLVCSAVGYKKKHEAIQGNNSINFILEKQHPVDTVLIAVSSNANHIVDEQVYDKKEEKERKELLERIKKGEASGEEEYSRPFTTKLEINAEFPGGDAGAVRYIMRNIKIPDTLHSAFYPIRPSSNEEFTGSMKVGFTVNKSGKAVKVTIIKGLDKLLDAEVVRVISTMPEWKPAVQNRITVDFYREFVLNFRIGIKKVSQ